MSIGMSQPDVEDAYGNSFYVQIVKSISITRGVAALSLVRFMRSLHGGRHPTDLPGGIQGARPEDGAGAWHLPLATVITREVLSLPMGPHLTEDVLRVTQAVRESTSALQSGTQA
jgi:hypothetical protein